MACAAPRASLNCSSPSVELFGFTRMPITSDFGTNSRNSSSLFAPSSYVEQAHPGGISARRLRLDTRPILTGSLTTREHDRNCLSGCFGSASSRRTARKDHCHLSANKLGRHRRQSVA